MVVQFQLRSGTRATGMRPCTTSNTSRKAERVHRTAFPLPPPCPTTPSCQAVSAAGKEAFCARRGERNSRLPSAQICVLWAGGVCTAGITETTDGAAPSSPTATPRARARWGEKKGKEGEKKRRRVEQGAGRWEEQRSGEGRKKAEKKGGERGGDERQGEKGGRGGEEARGRGREEGRSSAERDGTGPGAPRAMRLLAAALAALLAAAPAPGKRHRGSAAAAGAQPRQPRPGRNGAAPLGRPRDPGLRRGLPPSPSRSEAGAAPPPPPPSPAPSPPSAPGPGPGSGPQPRQRPALGRQERGLSERFRGAAARGKAGSPRRPAPLQPGGPTAAGWSLTPLRRRRRLSGPPAAAFLPGDLISNGVFKKESPSRAEVYGNGTSTTLCARRDNVELRRGTAGKAEAKKGRFGVVFSTGA